MQQDRAGAHDRPHGDGRDEEQAMDGRRGFLLGMPRLYRDGRCGTRGRTPLRRRSALVVRQDRTLQDDLREHGGARFRHWSVRCDIGRGGRCARLHEDSFLRLLFVRESQATRCPSFGLAIR